MVSVQTHHFPLGAEVGVALQCSIEGVLGNVGKHLVVQLVRRAVGYPAGHKDKGERSEGIIKSEVTVTSGSSGKYPL